MHVEPLIATHPSPPHRMVAGWDASCELAFCELLVQRTGLVLQSHQLSNLRDTVRKGCERFAFQDATQYLQAVQHSPVLNAPFEYLIAGVTVGESYFFRDSDQMDLLRNQLLPEMIAAKRASGNLSLRFWSAGCAQGQEIYSVAILLRELIPDIDKWSIHLIGTDINNEMVAKAIHGCYTEWSFRATPVALRDRWFTCQGHTYEIHPQIKRMVRFGYLNLTADVYPSMLNETNALDLILCRNVFIYLEQRAVQRSMAQYAHCLVEGGLVMLGASDPIHYQHTELVLVQNERTGYFRKVNVPDIPAPLYVPTIPTLPTTPVMPSMPVDNSWQRKTLGMHPVSSHSAARVLQTHAHKRSADEDIIQINQLIERADWQAALAQVEACLQHGKESSELWRLKAKILANTGNLELALQACERSLKLNTVNKTSYFLMGLILAERDQLPEAAEAFRKTLYLDHAFLEAHYEMGMLRVRAKDMSGAFKSLENALRLAKKGNPECKLHNAAGMTYGRFVQVLENEMEMLRGAEGSKPR